MGPWPAPALPQIDLDRLDRIALGDDAAFRILVTRYEARVYGMSLKMLGDAAQAHDAFQDTFLTVFRKAEGFRREARFSTWLYRVTANHCLMPLRKRSRRPIVDEPYSDPPDPGRLADEALETEEALHLLRRSIDALPEPYRIAILLRDVEGMSLAEISDVTQDSIAALKSRIHRGRLKLREAMHRMYGERGDKPHKKD